MDLYQMEKAKVKFTKHFPEEYRGSILKKVAFVLNYFPEYWNRIIKIGLEGSGFNAGHFGTIDDSGAYIRLVEEPGVYVIAHELMHGVQMTTDIPTGEKACDLYTLARSYHYSDRPPGYLDLPGGVTSNWDDWVEVVHFVAMDAIQERANGRRRYIKFFEDKIKEMFQEKMVK